MAKKNEVVEKDMGWLKIKKELKTMKKKGVKVGVLGDAERDDNADMIAVAIHNEFGTKNIPARPFIRGAYDAKRRELDKFKERLMAQILLGRITTNRALDVLGAHHAGQVQEYMTALSQPENAESTIEAKTRAGRKGDNPLIDTGQLRRSIAWERE